MRWRGNFAACREWRVVDFCGQERCGARGLAHREAGGEEKGGEGKGGVFGGGGLGLLLDPAARRATARKCSGPDAAKMRSARQLLRDGLGSGSMVREGSAERCAE